MNLTKKDYINILNYYGTIFDITLPINILRKMSEKIIAEKLCRCIKKVNKSNNNESRSIAICNKSVIKNKKLKIYKFSCKKKPQLKLKKLALSKDRKLYKTTRNKINLTRKYKKKKN
tara:strand:- start:5231 stop:5581 length:351 start_codon:yes stop_codon:yes gene_type:complete